MGTFGAHRTASRRVFEPARRCHLLRECLLYANPTTSRLALLPPKQVLRLAAGHRIAVPAGQGPCPRPAGSGAVGTGCLPGDPGRAASRMHLVGPRVLRRSRPRRLGGREEDGLGWTARTGAARGRRRQQAPSSDGPRRHQRPGTVEAIRLALHTLVGGPSSLIWLSRLGPAPSAGCVPSPPKPDCPWSSQQRNRPRWLVSHRLAEPRTSARSMSGVVPCSASSSWRAPATPPAAVQRAPRRRARAGRRDPTSSCRRQLRPPTQSSDAALLVLTPSPVVLGRLYFLEGLCSFARWGAGEQLHPSPASCPSSASLGPAPARGGSSSSAPTSIRRPRGALPASPACNRELHFDCRTCVTSVCMPGTIAVQAACEIDECPPRRRGASAPVSCQSSSVSCCSLARRAWSSPQSPCRLPIETKCQQRPVAPDRPRHDRASNAGNRLLGHAEPQGWCRRPSPAAN